MKISAFPKSDGVGWLRSKGAGGLVGQVTFHSLGLRSVQTSQHDGSQHDMGFCIICLQESSTKPHQSTQRSRVVGKIPKLTSGCLYLRGLGYQPLCGVHDRLWVGCCKL